MAQAGDGLTALILVEEDGDLQESNGVRRRAEKATAAVLVGAVILLGACALRPPFGDAEETSLQRLYQRAIDDAAVRHPDWNIPLWSFGDDATVQVSTFTDDPALDAVTQVNWVAPTAQLKSLCKGQNNLILFLEELLGLPPQIVSNPGRQWHVYTFSILQDALFRPCPGGVDSAVKTAPRCIAASAVDPHTDDATAQFLLRQFWYSHRKPSLGDGVADFGFPWTGMGWTYNWSPASRDHIGVSEFVVRKGALPINPQDASPADFCAAVE